MITITFYAKGIEEEINADNVDLLKSISGFRSEGHAGYAEHGKDIVCASASVLVANTVNSIHLFTSDEFFYDENEESGMIELKITSEVSPESSILLRSLFLGMRGIQDMYGEEFVRIVFQNL